MFHDCASHDIDVQRWIAQEDPVSLYATGSCFSKEIEAVGIGDWDTVTISLKYPSGKLGLVDVSRHATYGYGLLAPPPLKYHLYSPLCLSQING